MKMSVYLAEDSIQVVLGKPGRKIKIVECKTYELKKGTLINDVVADEEYMKEVLCCIGEEFKKYRDCVHLMMGSNQILTKVIQVPPMPNRLLLELVKRELDEYYNTEKLDPVYDYSVIRRKNLTNRGGTILCAAMERKKIEYGRNLFKECGMKIKAIDIALNAVLRLTEYLPSLKEKTYIISILDGKNLRSCLYVNGIYVYTSRFRLLSERETDEATQEILRSIVGIVRFHTAQRAETEIKQIYFAGIQPEEQDVLFRKIREVLGICSEVLKGEQEFDIKEGSDYNLNHYVYATGNLFER